MMCRRSGAADAAIACLLLHAGPHRPLERADLADGQLKSRPRMPQGDTPGTPTPRHCRRATWALAKARISSVFRRAREHLHNRPAYPNPAVASSTPSTTFRPGCSAVQRRRPQW